MINETLLNELKKITKEEHILNGRQGIEKELYMSTASSYDDNNIIDAKKLLDSGKLIQVRPHTRFVHFPKHTHNYIEVIYMCSGQTHHVIDAMLSERYSEDAKEVKAMMDKIKNGITYIDAQVGMVTDNIAGASTSIKESSAGILSVTDDVIELSNATNEIYEEISLNRGNAKELNASAEGFIVE